LLQESEAQVKFVLRSVAFDLLLHTPSQCHRRSPFRCSRQRPFQPGPPGASRPLSKISEPVENGSVFTEIGRENRRSGSIKAKNGSEIGVFGSDFISSPGLAVPFLLPAKKT
jgi:hypothetical protein